ncbi:MAG: radical SAM protein, partial [Candidatus Schekmanbacteria bacterium]
MKHLIIPVFIPHAGCPQKCIYCNQNKVTLEKGFPKTDVIDRNVNLYLNSSKKDKRSKRKYSNISNEAIKVEIGIPFFRETIREIAFFGGSFTGIDNKIQKEFLDGAQKWISAGIVDGIRISTRPDLINEENIEWLKEKKVTTIELGAQSFSDDVLKKSERGHSTYSTIRASKIIKNAGLRLGIQLMMGLPKEDEKSFIAGIKKAVSLKPEFIRIYPLLILPETKIMEMYLKNEYKPLSLDETIHMGAKALKILYKNNIPCIRFGLPENNEYKGTSIIGPYHPSLKHMIDSKLAYATMYR